MARTSKAPCRFRDQRKLDRLLPYSKKAEAAGWIWDEGGPHWFKPPTHPLHEHGQYAKSAKEVCEIEGIA